MNTWWQHAVIYQIYVRSFADSDGTGVGDLAGIASRLPYLAQLGVDAVWITPFYRSPMADGGYDVADYREVDPVFGTLADVDRVVADAHALGIRVIVDVVPNHTSAAHRWFVAALAAGEGSTERDRYVFRPGQGPDGSLPPNDWRSVFGGPAWSRTTRPDGSPGEWYLHLFDSSQPDLNWEHPEVRAEFADVLRFWLDRGVDGFRIDVAHGLVKAEGLPDEGTDGPATLLEPMASKPYWDQEGVHEIYRQWRQVLDAYSTAESPRIFVAEAWVSDPERLSRYLRADELHQAFNFGYLKAAWDAEQLRAAIDAALATCLPVGAQPSWVLSNHDMVRHPSRYAPDDPELGERRARAALLLTLALPGGAYLYQGEELGLREVTDLPDKVLQDPIWERSGRTERGRDGCRVPLPWAGDTPPFGFGPDGMGQPWLPMPPAWAGHTVERQLADPASMLRFYQRALRIRRELGLAEPLRWLPAPASVLAFERGDGFVCTVNLGAGEVELAAPGDLVAASAHVSRHDDRIWLPTDAAAWWRR